MPFGQLLDARHALVAALGHDVGRAELAGELLPRLVPAHRDDPLGAHLLGREHAKQTHRAVADDHDRRAGLTLAASAANQPVPSTSEVASRLGIRSSDGTSGVGDQRAVRERHAQQRRLRARAMNSRCTHDDLIAVRGRCGQVLSEAKNEPTTNWPGLTVCTALPTSSTMPQYS